MSDKKYMIHPGYVESVSDGQIHFIGFGRLCSLYGVRPSECVNARSPTATQGLRGGERGKKFVHLFTRGDGRYRLPTYSET